MTTRESSEHKTGRSEYPNPEEVEEIDFKRNIIKIIEDLEQNVKKKRRRQTKR